MTTVNVNSYGSSLKCCVCVYNQARGLQTMRLLGKDNQELSDHREEPNHEKTAELLCNDCKMQRYCSVAHLTEDLEHRDFCRIMKEIQQVEGIEHPLFLQGIVLSRTMLNQTISQLKLILSVKLRRPLSLREKEVIANPGFCVICYRTTPLNVCAGCAGVAYCSENHRHLYKDYHTPQVCRTLALLYSPYRLLDYKFQIEKFHRGSIIAESHLVGAFYNATLLEVNDRPWKTLQQYDLFAACSSFSTIATVCLALTQISIVAEPDKAVIVYIVGATSECLRYFEEMHLKFFFLQYESVQNLELHFIGNMLKPQEPVESIICVGDLKRSVAKRIIPFTFTRFSKTNKIDPTLIIMLQPDLTGIGNMTHILVKQFYPFSAKKEEPDDRHWPECLTKILHTYGAPICFTSISKVQAHSNYSVFNDLARENDIVIKRAFDIAENPYRGILPLRNHCAEDPEMIVYTNNYLEVLFTNPKY